MNFVQFGNGDLDLWIYFAILLPVLPISALAMRMDVAGIWAWLVARDVEGNLARRMRMGGRGKLWRGGSENWESKAGEMV